MLSEEDALLKTLMCGLRSEGHTCDAAWPQAIPNGQRDVVLGADVQDLVPVHVRKVLCVVQQAQLRAQHTSRRTWRPHGRSQVAATLLGQSKFLSTQRRQVSNKT